MKLITATLVLGLLPYTALACPVEPAVSERIPEAFDRLAAAPDERVAKGFEDRIWQAWRTAPDGTAQDLLDAGIRRIRVSDYEGAEAILTDLITYCSDYPAGWNQRAFARFLQGRHDAALADIDEVLSREPKHFAALSGRFRIFLSQGRMVLARRALSDALAIHPFLNDRFLMPAGTKI